MPAGAHGSGSSADLLTDLKRPSSTQRAALAYRVDAAALGLSTVQIGPETTFLVLRQLRDALELGEPARVVRSLGMRCMNGTGIPYQWPAAERNIARMAEVADRLASPEAHGWVHLAQGVLRWFQVRMHEAAPHLLAAEEIWSERCVGVARLQTTTRMYLATALAWSGHLAEACRRVHQWSKEADDRDDLYLAVRCGSLAHFSWLPLDEPDRARHDLDVTRQRWRRSSFDFVDWACSMSASQVELYDGAGERAWLAVSNHWHTHIESLVAAVPVFRHLMFLCRGTAALGAAAQAAVSPDYMGAAAECAAELTSLELPGSEAFARLLHAGIAELAGDADSALIHYASAAALIGDGDPVMASISAARRGRLLGGDEGRDLVARAHAVLTAQGIKNPERWMRMVTPAALRD